MVKKVSANSQAFTVVELLIVIVVIAILAAVSIVAYNSIQRQAIAGVLRSDLSNAAKQLEMEKVSTNDRYADDVTALKRSKDTTFQYTSTGIAYCLTATSSVSGVSSYYISSETGTPREGLCPGHVAMSGGGSVPSNQQAKLLASDGAAGDIMGGAVSISGDTAVVGAEGNATNAGAAYVFTRSGSTWTQQAKLTASDGAAEDRFGVSASISGNTVVVGAYFNDSAGVFSGAAYVFTRSGSTWTQQAKLTPSDATANSYFGKSVSISGDSIAVGAELGAEITGSAYVFTRSGSTWTQQAKLNVDGGLPYQARYGYSISISGDSVVVGATDDTGIDVLTGAAYVFTRSGSTWTQQAKLTASDGVGFNPSDNTSDSFGHAVSISGDTVVAGAVNHDNPTTNSGAAYVFSRSGSTWTQQAKLTASDGAVDSYFGYSVSNTSDTVVIGAEGQNAFGGAAYVFSRSGSTWTQQAKLVASDSATNDTFGESVSISGGTIGVGTIYRDENGLEDIGAAYIFN